MQTISRAKVVKVEKVTNEVSIFYLELDKYRPFETGQFLQLALEEDITASDIWPESRAFSISSAWKSDNKSITIVVKKKGLFTTKMFKKLIEGSFCTLKYPFGDMIFPFELRNDLILVAGGTGIAPFIGFSEEFKAKSFGRVKLLYSVQTSSELIKLEQFREQLGSENIEVFCTRENNNFSKNRRIETTDIIRDVSDIASAHFYICGSMSFINTFKRELEEKGAKNIFVDEWE